MARFWVVPLGRAWYGLWSGRAWYVILNEAQRSEGSGLREENLLSMARSSGFASG
jgi:hypothetical protein